MVWGHGVPLTRFLSTVAARSEVCPERAQISSSSDFVVRAKARQVARSPDLRRIRATSSKRRDRHVVSQSEFFAPVPPGAELSRADARLFAREKVTTGPVVTKRLLQVRCAHPCAVLVAPKPATEIDLGLAESVADVS